MRKLLPDWLISAEGFSALAGEAIPVYEPGGTPTGHCPAAVRGRRFLRVSAAPQASLIALNSTADGGNITVAECNAIGQRVDGVANRDVAAGGKVGVLATPGLIVPVIAGAAIAADQLVMSDAQGRAIPYVAGAGRFVAGVCVEGAAAADAVCVVILGGVGGGGVGAAFAQQAANPDTAGAALAALETEVNEIKAALRAVGIIAP